MIFGIIAIVFWVVAFMMFIAHFMAYDEYIIYEPLTDKQRKRKDMLFVIALISAILSLACSIVFFVTTPTN